MGYYPFGSKLFTNLVHYVRSGDFAEALLSEAENVNEYAFALGVLCHYYADEYGHSLATNKSVPFEYPKMGKKYGDVVTYADNKISHTRMEFAFDVLETARGNYASTAYHDYIGFKVSRPVLERAFRKTYGIDVDSVFGDLSLAIETFRWSVKNLMPAITKIAWATRKNEILKLTPNATAKSFIYKMNKLKYYQEFGKGYKKPGFGATVFGLIIKVLPKIGPLRPLKFREATQAAEKLYIGSFDTAQLHYTNALSNRGAVGIYLHNINYDTGQPTTENEYILADKTYGELLVKLEERHFDSVDALLQRSILTFYNFKGTSNYAKENPRAWQKIQLALKELKESKALVAAND